MFLWSLTMLMRLSYHWIKRSNYNGCWKCSRKQFPGESQVLWKTCIMQSLRTICEISSAWSAYMLLHKTPSHHLDKLISTTVFSFKRGRGSPLNVYRRKQFATIKEDVNCQLGFYRHGKFLTFCHFGGQFLIVNEKLLLPSRKWNKTRITFVLPLPAFPS